MKKRTVFALGAIVIAGAGAVAFDILPDPAHRAEAATDARQAPPIVRLVKATPVTTNERGFTGIIGARVESNLGFRVPGKIVDRLVSVGDEIKTGQPLLRIDDTDLRLALTAKRTAIAAAQAAVVQARADEERYAALLKDGWVPRQRYEQTRAALDTAEAQLAAAEADAEVAGNEATYAVLLADADGTVLETLGEPGQVVAAGQPVVRLAQAGPREAVISLPETIRPAIGSAAEVNLYGSDRRGYTAHLRQLSNSADARTRTYEARYVLDGEDSAAPLGATVTLSIEGKAEQSEVQVPLGALHDDGQKTGVWILDGTTSTVHLHPVRIVRITDESAVVAGLTPQDRVVALGAHLLQEGARVRPESASESN
ncbi:efflux transporter periplasmic adaptor subunit [Sulfitobacter sp. EhC04]|uniref:efflux RND transporter periplasmic adaptor subunit n=1 Tax=Sulfitobacter sp. EhC04 TaxID=1849168 RepID=UPI0007F4D189|nr:efflux RND transporter periplasmic adaptor subunit [Sulfitobacter sp. EhC04]OAN78614.1 efflux transporter periplasmic adaptor subunit [Sulfitobacter sp. EhC04]